MPANLLTTTAIGLAVLTLLAFAFWLFQALRAVRALRISPPAARVVALDEVPEAARVALAKEGDRLACLGFETLGYLTETPLVGPTAQPTWYRIARTPDCVAVLSPQGQLTPGWACRWELQSSLADGTQLVTFDGILHFLLAAAPGTQLVDPYPVTPEDQLAAHRAAYAGRTAEADADMAAFLARHEARQQVLYGMLSEDGRRDRLPWPRAFGFLWQIVRGSSKARRLRQARAAATDGGIDPDSFNQLLDGAPLPGDQLSPGIAMALAFVVGLGVFGSGQLPAPVVLVELLMIAATYMGVRIIAQGLAGYPHVILGALPFGGWPAWSKPPADAGPLRQAIVLLAGPLPLLVGGFWIWWAWPIHGVPSATLLTLGILGAAFGYLNLLPVLPLDGGKLVRVWLGAASLLVQLTFLLVCAVLLGFAMPMMAGVAWLCAAVLVLTSRRDLLVTLAAARAARGVPLAEVMQRSPFRRLSPAFQLDVARRVRSYGPRPRFVVRFAGVVIYLLIVLAPAAIAYRTLPHPHRHRHPRPAPNLTISLGLTEYI